MVKIVVALLQKSTEAQNLGNFPRNILLLVFMSLKAEYVQ